MPEVRELLREARDLGYTAARTGGGHIRLSHPDADSPVFMPSTPSEYRSRSAALFVPW
jgi:predicted RNA binding protein YcfA (HicA-like mRNA interferase family)